MRPGRDIAAALLAQRGHLIGWVPVCLATGIGLYFALPAEPGAGDLAALAVLAAAAGWAGRRAGTAWAPLFHALALVAAGLALGAVRSHAVAAPVLEWRYYGAIQGRIVEIDRSASDKPRLTLDRVVLERVPPERTPRRVRVSLHGQQGWIAPVPGQVVILTGHLGPPPGPAEPGGFDFRRLAWFEGLGAVGYTRTPVLLWAPPEGGAALRLHRVRATLASALRERIGGDAGAVAAAIAVGDRSGIDAETVQALRDSNLAHLLAISGLHMGLLTGFVFALVRYGLALVPALALRLPAKKIAAVVALAAGAAYLALSGGAVATERAFVMVAMMLAAILVDRRALTLRAVALAAVVILVRRPEELAGPGFQMSFAATVALVAVFSALRDLPGGRMPRWARPVASVVLSSLVAGLATAPVAAAHFNQMASYGFPANLLSVPVMGAVVMPAAVVAACLAPLGLAAPALWVMERGLSWILFVATTAAGQEGAVRHVVAPAGGVLPLIAAGGAVLVLWQGRARWLGVLPAVAALALWVATERPVLLVADSGGLVGVMGEDARGLTKAKGDGFAAAMWLENDGTGLTQAEAHARGGLARGTRAGAAGMRVLHVTGRTALGRIEGCGGADVLVTNVPAGARPCVVLDTVRLRRTGAVAGHAGPAGLRLVTAREVSGDRPWTPGFTGGGLLAAVGAARAGEVAAAGPGAGE